MLNCRFTKMGRIETVGNVVFANRDIFVYDLDAPLRVVADGKKELDLKFTRLCVQVMPGLNKTEVAIHPMVADTIVSDIVWLVTRDTLFMEYSSDRIGFVNGVLKDMGCNPSGSECRIDDTEPLDLHSYEYLRIYGRL